MTHRSTVSPLRIALHLAALVAVMPAVGCTSMLMFGGDKPVKSLEQLTSEPTTRMVGKYTHPYGMSYMKIESLSLVTGLDGTGEDPPPSPQRASILAEMQRRGIENTQEILASPNTAIVLMKGYLPPGAQEGDRFDVEVRTPTRSESTSLRGGWVLPARMTELAVLGGQIHEGHVLAVAEGPILVDPSATTADDKALATKGRLLGGGIVSKSRPLGLIIGQEHKSFRLSTQIAKDINSRFYATIGGRRQGVAEPKRDDFIEISVHPRYKDNINRYMRVLRAVALAEPSLALQERLALLQGQLLDPVTTSAAAIQLEAIGNDAAVAVLEKGLVSPEPEVRLYAAESLAYLDKTSAVETLQQIALEESAYRINAMAALSAMNDVLAYDALRNMLDSTSSETRYGAFRSLWVMNPKEPLIAGEQLGGAFSYHVLDVGGPAMVHVTNSHRPEVVLFGAGQQFKLPMLLEAGPKILVNGMQGTQITVSRFSADGEPDQRVVSTSLDEVIRAVVDLGGNYPDVVQMLQQAKQQNALESRFKIDALPEPGRTSTSSDNEDDVVPESKSPLPDLLKRT